MLSNRPGEADAVGSPELVASPSPSDAGLPGWRPDPITIAGFAGLNPDAVEVVDSIGSTNQALMGRPWLENAALPRLLLACRQLDGRGRRGRGWLSGHAGSLTFSVALELPLALAGSRLVGLPVVAGLAIAEHLDGLTDGIALKWPNDLQRHGRKVAGLLFESRVHRDRIRVVGGVGLNLLPEPQVLAKVGQPAAALFDHPHRLPSRDQLAGQLAALLITAVSGELTGDLSVRWARFDSLAGRPVDIFFDGRRLHAGTAAGICPDGALRLRQAGGELRIDAGEVSVRLEGSPAPEASVTPQAAARAHSAASPEGSALPGSMTRSGVDP